MFDRRTLTKESIGSEPMCLCLYDDFGFDPSKYFNDGQIIINVDVQGLSPVKNVASSYRLCVDIINGVEEISYVERKFVLANSEQTFNVDFSVLGCKLMIAPKVNFDVNFCISVDMSVYAR